MNTKIINLKGLRKGLHTDSYTKNRFLQTVPIRDGAIYIYKYEKVKPSIGSEIPIYHETIPYITRQCHILRDNPIYHETIPYIPTQSHISREISIYHETILSAIYSSLTWYRRITS